MDRDTSEVDRLFEQYVSEHRAGGEARPWASLEQLESVDREELAALIDSYLARSPGTDWNPEAFRGSPAEELADRLALSLQGRSGLWPAMLPRLRERAKMTRTDLARRLADALGVGEHEQKVADYYHQMEQGLLSSEGVSAQVLARLGEIINAKPEWLRRIGETAGPTAASGEAAPAFARTAEPAPRYRAEAREATSEGVELDAEWDEVDRLFREGE